MTKSLRRLSLCVALLLTVMMAAFALLRAQEAAAPAKIAPQDITEIKSLIDNYGKAFSNKDYETIRSEVQAPYVNFNGNIATTATVDEVVANFKRGRDPMDNADYGGSKPVEVRVIALTARTALANIHWKVFKKDGSFQRDGGEIFLVSKVTGSWKLAGAMHQDPPEFTKVY